LINPLFLALKNLWRLNSHEGPEGQAEHHKGDFAFAQQTAYVPDRASFNAIFCFLLAEGYVEKSGLELRAPYRITEKGSRMLEAL
jgi:hypothetical protein